MLGSGGGEKGADNPKWGSGGVGQRPGVCTAPALRRGRMGRGAEGRGLSRFPRGLDGSVWANVGEMHVHGRAPLNPPNRCAVP